MGAISEESTPEDDQTEKAQKAELYTFAVVNSAPFIYAGTGRPIKALVALGVAGLYDVAMSLRVREKCVNSAYGPGHF
jgi:hypothetical protein